MMYEVLKNAAGAVFVCLEYENPPRRGFYQAGFAFCNPKYLPSSTLSREEWPKLGWVIAAGRLAKKPVLIQIPDEFADLASRSGLRATLRNVLATTPWLELGCRPYAGRCDNSERERWQRDFINTMKSLVPGFPTASAQVRR